MKNLGVLRTSNYWYVVLETIAQFKRAQLPQGVGFAWTTLHTQEKYGLSDKKGL